MSNRMKDVQGMTKLDCLLELRTHAHHSWYPSLTDWKIEQLRALLTFYRSGGRYPSEMMGKITRARTMADEVREMRGERCIPFIIEIEVRRAPSPKLFSWLRR